MVSKIEIYLLLVSEEIPMYEPVSGHKQYDLAMQQRNGLFPSKSAADV